MSRQARKEAATAARDLLKVDAAQVRKGAGAAQMRKGAAPAMQNGAAAVKQKGAAAAMQKGAAAASSAAADTPSRSYTDGSFFFNGSAGDFFSSPGSTSQPWNHPSSDPAMWGTNATPQGGFTNLIQPQMSQNFIFGGEASQYASFRLPQTTQDAQSEEGFSTPMSAKDKRSYVNVDNEEEAPRTEKRIFWSQEEDVRMMSSWLLNSTDSSCGADRRNEQYWTDVEATYNETAPSHRARYAKQIKDRFHKDEQNASRLKVLEVQQKLSSEKLESAKIAHLAAKEQKEARKYELESRMFETYNHLLTMDLSLMSDEEKLDHANTMKCLKKKLFADN
ncbi:unnamed protein product [Urochloa humidicola]